jgi:hypothetical protein
VVQPYQVSIRRIEIGCGTEEIAHSLEIISVPDACSELCGCYQSSVCYLAATHRTNLVRGQRDYRYGFTVEGHELDFIPTVLMQQYYGPQVTGLQAVLWEIGGQNNRVQLFNHMWLF